MLNPVCPDVGIRSTAGLTVDAGAFAHGSLISFCSSIVLCVS